MYIVFHKSLQIRSTKRPSPRKNQRFHIFNPHPHSLTGELYIGTLTISLKMYKGSVEKYKSGRALNQTFALEIKI